MVPPVYRRAFSSCVLVGALFNRRAKESAQPGEAPGASCPYCLLTRMPANQRAARPPATRWHLQHAFMSLLVLFLRRDPASTVRWMIAPRCGLSSAASPGCRPRPSAAPSATPASVARSFAASLAWLFFVFGHTCRSLHYAARIHTRCLVVAHAVAAECNGRRGFQQQASSG